MTSIDSYNSFKSKLAKKAIARAITDENNNDFAFLVREGWMLEDTLI